MTWLRDWSWKIAILLLPWQVRWFSEGPSVGGLPWEQGRMSVYASWVPMIITTFLASRISPASAEAKLRLRAGRHHASSEEEGDRPPTVPDWIMYAGILLLGLPAFVSVYPQASWQWMTQVVILAFFAWSLRQLSVPGRDLLAWSVISIIPHALLAVWQYATQYVVGSKWVGMASQDPLTLGVSVVEVAGRRVLRAYGGMPHPNILGGWLAYGLVALTTVMSRFSHLASRISHRQNQKLLFALCSLLAIALVLTFSRSAWMAAIVGIIVATMFAWRKAWTLEEKLRTLFVPCTIFVVGCVTLFLVRDVALARVDTGTRLETKSVSERSASMSAAWSIVPEQWWLGQGQNTAIFVLDRAGEEIVPPHFIPLLILLETGLIGSFGVLLLLWRWMRHVGPLVFVSFAVAMPLLFLDHYLWSLWAGQSLVMLVALLPLTKGGKTDKETARI